MGPHILELLKSHLLRLIGDCLKGSTPKDLDDASSYTIRQLYQVLDEALIDFRCRLLERQQCKVSGNEPSKLLRFGPYGKLVLLEATGDLGVRSNDMERLVSPGGNN